MHTRQHVLHSPSDHGPVWRGLVSILRVDKQPLDGNRHQQPGWTQLVVVAGALALYEAVRLIADTHRQTAIAHARDLLNFEQLLGVDWEHAAQNFSLHVDLLRMAANGVYTWMYWPVVIGSLLLTWRYDRYYYAVLRDGMLLSGAVGLVVFAAFPVAPPRMLPEFIDTIAPGSLEHTVVHGSIADSYAALPSFHVGWVALGAVILATSAGRTVAPTGRALMLSLAIIATAAMAGAVVVTANHFVLDAVSGVAVALAGGLVADRLHRRSLPTGPDATGTSDAPQDSAHPSRLTREQPASG